MCFIKRVDTPPGRDKYHDQEMRHESGTGRNRGTRAIAAGEMSIETPTVGASLGYSRGSERAISQLLSSKSLFVGPYKEDRDKPRPGRARGETGARHTGDDAPKEVRHKALMLELQPFHSFHRVLGGSLVPVLLFIQEQALRVRFASTRAKIE